MSDETPTDDDSPRVDALGRPFNPRSTAYEIMQRENEIAQWICRGMSPYDIQKRGSEEWGLSRSQVKRYYTNVLAEMRAENRRDRADLVLEHELRREHLYRVLLKMAGKAKKAGDVSGATAALNGARVVLTDLARIQALYPADRASLARAGLDQQLAEQLGTKAAAMVRDLLRSAYDERTRRGLTPVKLTDADLADLEAEDEGDDAYDGGDLGESDDAPEDE